MDPIKLSAWWWHRQGLDGSLESRSETRTPAAILQRSGWSRSLGGVGPYLTFFARGGVSREAADAAAARLEIHELPSARGCTYVLPASDFALGLKVGEGADDDMRLALKLGVTDKEIDKLCRAVLDALAGSPLEPEVIREATGKASRSLGEEGKKKGMTTTLPLALGRLQAAGDIRRVATNGRFDQQRYRYALWTPNPLKGFGLSAEQAHVELARRYFRWIEPAALREFQDFSGLGVRAARAAIEPLGLIPLEPGTDMLISPEGRESYESFRPPRDPQVHLLSSIDAIVLHRNDMKGMTDAKDRVKDLTNHPIVDRGRLVGLWEYDPGASEIVWTSWSKDEAVAGAVGAAVARTEAFVRDQLGDARSFSLDSPKSRAPRIAALRRKKR